MNQSTYAIALVFNLLQGSLLVVAAKLLSMKEPGTKITYSKVSWWMRETIRDPIMSTVVIVIQVDPQPRLVMDLPKSIEESCSHIR